MNTRERVKNSLTHATQTLNSYNKKMVDFETNVMLFNGANIIKNINELTLMQESLAEDVKSTLAISNSIGISIEQFCIENGLEYEFNEFSVHKGIMEKMNTSLDATNHQIMDCVSSVASLDSLNPPLPTSISRRTRQAKLKKSK